MDKTAQEKRLLDGMKLSQAEWTAIGIQNKWIKQSQGLPQLKPLQDLSQATAMKNAELGSRQRFVPFVVIEIGRGEFEAREESQVPTGSPESSKIVARFVNGKNEPGRKPPL